MKMKMRMKKVLAVILAATMLLSLSACRTPSEFYHEVVLGETSPNGKKAKKESDNKEDKTEDKKEDKTEESTEDVEYAEEENQEFQDFLWDYFEKSVTSDTIEYKSSIKDPSSYPDIVMEEATLGDARMDQEAVAESKKEDEEFLDDLLAFEDAELTEDERFTYECLKRDMEINMHKYDNIYFYDPFTPMRGVQEGLTSSLTDFAFDNKQDVENYITMIGQIRDYFGELIKFEYEKSDAGYFMSDSIADDVIEQCDEFMKNKDDHVLIESFDEKVEAVDFLSEDEKADFKEQNKTAVLDVIIPAYEDLKSALEELKGTSQNDLGLPGYDGGKQYYADYIFPKYSSSAKTPEEEIEVMDKRWDDLILQMTAIYYSNSEAYEWYVDHSEDAFEKYDEMDIEELVNFLQENCMDDYPLEGSIPFNIKYMSDSVAKISDSTLAYYQVCPVDDPDYNLIVVNGLHDTDLFNTLAHEGTPGHMFQFWYFRNTNPNPARSVAFNLGYIEGWAVYSSNDVLKNFDFEGGNEYGSVIGQLAQIDMDLSYLMIGRVDLGVNYEGWDKNDIADYLKGKVAEGNEESAAEELMNTVIGDPGAYLSYTTGFYEMEELRQYAENELGSKFDAKEYHKTVLDAGSCQFDMLKKKIDEYISENK